MSTNFCVILKQLTLPDKAQTSMLKNINIYIHKNIDQNHSLDQDTQYSQEQR